MSTAKNSIYIPKHARTPEIWPPVSPDKYYIEATIEKSLGKLLPPSSSIFDNLYLHKSTLLGNKEFIEAPNGL